MRSNGLEQLMTSVSVSATSKKRYRRLTTFDEVPLG